MSPEQALGQAVDARSDLFSLGSVLYAMCTGRSPFRAETTIAALRRVCEDAPRPIREVNPQIPDWLVEIIDRLLAKRPDERFQTAAEVAELLGQHLALFQHPASPTRREESASQSKIQIRKSKIVRLSPNADQLLLSAKAVVFQEHIRISRSEENQSNFFDRFIDT
jgi:serine/threonine protein kinase